MSVGLCMIVKDEAGVIERCLASARPHIGHWTICDTGSSDDTPKIVRRALKGLPGKLHATPWRDFATNRTKALELARKHPTDYTLMLDADLTVEGHIPAMLTADAYRLRIADGQEYKLPLLTRTAKPFAYESPVHNYLVCSEPYATADLDELVIHDHGDGNPRPDRMTEQARLLEEQLDANPDDSRAIFYLAQTYRDLGRTREAIDLYHRRSLMNGFREEAFIAAREEGKLRLEQGHPAAENALMRAWALQPDRAEPLYHLARHLRLKGDIRPALELALIGSRIPFPADAIFLVPRWIYDWGLPLEVALCHRALGNKPKALSLMRKIRRANPTGQYRAFVDEQIKELA